MTREELTAKNKTDLLALAVAASLAATPAMSKADLVELLVANAQMTAVTPAAIPAPVATPDLAARIAALEAELSTANTTIADQADTLAKSTALATDKLVVDDGKGLPKEGALRALDGSLAGTKKVRITIMATEGEKEDVKIGVNGHLIQIKRGVPVVVDVAYLEVLKNSTIDTIMEDDNGKRTQVQMQRYPFMAEPV